MYAVIRNNAAGSLQIVAYHPGTPLPFGWQVVFVGNLRACQQVAGVGPDGGG